LARKIICYAKTGDEAVQGKQMGFIKFGSRVDLFIPMDWEVLVKPGDKVTGSVTALAAVVTKA
jgi:phosphatidylserine decarboxylase